MKAERVVEGQAKIPKAKRHMRDPARPLNGQPDPAVQGGSDGLDAVMQTVAMLRKVVTLLQVLRERARNPPCATVTEGGIQNAA